MSNRRHPFALTSPCENCPFRTDVVPFMTRTWATTMNHTIEHGIFYCHKTQRRAADGISVDSSNGAHCAGALVFLEKLNRPSNAMRVAERLGFYDVTKLDMDAPVYESFEAMAAAQEDGGTKVKVTRKATGKR